MDHPHNASLDAATQTLIRFWMLFHMREYTNPTLLARACRNDLDLTDDMRVYATLYTIACELFSEP
jgi:hypothetical protein